MDGSSQLKTPRTMQAAPSDAYCASAVGRKSIAHCTFLGLAVFITVVTVVATGIVSIKLSKDAIDLAVTEKTADILNGVEQLVTQRQMRMSGISMQFAQRLASIGPITTIRDTVAAMNATYFLRSAGLVLDPDAVMGISTRILFPLVGSNQPPNQNKTLQMGSCEVLCARPGDPHFTHAAAISMFRDNNFNHVVPWYGITDDEGANVTSYVFENYNSPTHLPNLGEKIYEYDALLNLNNGTFFEGLWNRPHVQMMLDGNANYYISFARQYYLQDQGAIGTVIVYDAIHRLFDLSQQSLTTSDVLVFTDELGHVLTTSNDPFGDARFRNCTRKASAPFFSDICQPLPASSQPDPLVRGVLTLHLNNINRATVTRTASINGADYLVTSRRIVDIDRLILIATYITPKSDLYGSFRRDSTSIVILCAVLVFITALALAVLCLVLLHRSLRTIAMTHTVAESLAVLNTDAAMQTLEKSTGGAADQDILGHLVAVTSYLSAYKPFLPQSVVGALTTSGSHSALLSSSSSGVVGVSQVRLPAGDSVMTTSALEADRPTMSCDTFMGTSFATSRGTVVVMNLIGCYFSDVKSIECFHETTHHVIKSEGGVIDLFTPTSVLATWNYHLSCPQHPQAAGRAVSQIVARLRSEGLRAVCAIVTSINGVATFGSSTRKTRMVNGNGVELAWKLLRLGVALDVNVLMNENASHGYPAPTTLFDVVTPHFDDPKNQRGPFSIFVPSSVLGSDVAVQTYRQAMGFLRSQQHSDATRVLQLALSGIASSDAPVSSHLVRLLEICESPVLRCRSSYSRMEQWWECHEPRWSLEVRAGNSNSGVGVQLPVLKDSREPSLSGTSDAFARVQQQRNAPCEIGAACLFAQIVQPAAANERGGEEQSREEEVHGLDERSASTVTCPFTAITDSHGEEWQIASGTPLDRCVFFAVSSNTGSTAALKLFPMPHSEVVPAVRKAVDSLSALRHPNVTHIISCCFTTAHCGIIREYVGGGSLRMFLTRIGLMSPTAARSVMISVVRGLQYLHDLGFAHSNLHPGNVLFTTDGTWKLSGFGTVRITAILTKNDYDGAPSGDRGVVSVWRSGGTRRLSHHFVRPVECSGDSC